MSSAVPTHAPIAIMATRTRAVRGQAPRAQTAQHAQTAQQAQPADEGRGARAPRGARGARGAGAGRGAQKAAAAPRTPRKTAAAARRKRKAGSATAPSVGETTFGETTFGAPCKTAQPPCPRIECSVCETVLRQPQLYTQPALAAMLLARAAQAEPEVQAKAEGQAEDKAESKASAEVKALAEVKVEAEVKALAEARAGVLTECACGETTSVCFECLALHMRSSRTATSACMCCKEALGEPEARFVLVAVSPKGLSDADESLLALIGRQAAMRAAAMRTNCPCHGIPMVRRSQRYFVPDQERATLRQLSECAKAHPVACVQCFSDCRKDEDCRCRRGTWRANPYYREPGGSVRTRRNDEITPAMAVAFINRLLDEPAAHVECLCGTLLFKTVDCHEVACKCGADVCVACGRAEYRTGTDSALRGHYSKDNADGSAPCLMFAHDYSVRFGGAYLNISCPCHSSEGDHPTSTQPACHGLNHDCTDPDHQQWRECYNGNRRVVHARRFLGYLSGSAAYQAACSAYLRHPQRMSFE